MPASLIAASGIYFVQQTVNNPGLKVKVPKIFLKSRAFAYTIPVFYEYLKP